MLDAKVQIYTGHGKGKTTAAFGLCLRALGHNMSLLVVQFRKGMESGERISAERLGLPLLLCTNGRNNPPCSASCRLLCEINSIIKKEPPDILLLDEIMAAIKNGCVTKEEVLTLLASSAGQTEVVLTGRDAPAELLAAADLVTSMEPIRHYYGEGVKARRGIEY